MTGPRTLGWAMGGAAVLLLLSATTWGLVHTARRAPTDLGGRTAPDMTIRTLQDGREIQLADLRAHGVVEALLRSETAFDAPLRCCARSDEMPLRDARLTQGGPPLDDLVLVAEIAGHKRLETTRRYSLPSAQDRENAMQSLEVDY